MGNVNAGSSGAVPTYFDGPVGGAGVSPANNPQGAGWKAIGRNEPVYIDYTCILNGYTVDQTRMFCIGELANPMLLRHMLQPCAFRMPSDSLYCPWSHL